jgi:hypothetical protein
MKPEEIIGAVGGLAAASVATLDLVSAAGSVVGLSAAGMTSGLAAIGSVVGGGMATGIVTTAAIPAAGAVIGGVVVHHAWNWLTGGNQ